MFGAEDWGIVALGGFAAFLANVLYMWGGTEMVWGGQKWLRRYLGSFVLALAASGIAFYLGVWSWKYLLMYPALAIGFSLGYGADTTMGKILRRSVFALGSLTACLVGAWAVGFTGAALLVLGVATIVGMTSVALGVWNPFKNAPLEQFLISQLLCMFIPFWGFIS